MNSIYLSAAFHRKNEMAELAKQIEALGVKVTSRWLYEPPLTNPSEAGKERFLRDTAYMDATDVLRAETLVRFSDDMSTPTVPTGWVTASRMEETGMAHAWGKTIIIVGGMQSLFDRFPHRVHVKDTAELLAFLTPGRAA